MKWAGGGGRRVRIAGCSNSLPPATRGRVIPKFHRPDYWGPFKGPREDGLWILGITLVEVWTVAAVPDEEGCSIKEA